MTYDDIPASAEENLPDEDSSFEEDVFGEEPYMQTHELEEDKADGEAGEEDGRACKKKEKPHEVADVFKAAPGCQKLLMSTMEACREMLTPSELDSFMKEMLSQNRTVLRPVELRKLLERYGAIEYIPSEEEKAVREEEEFREAQKAAGAAQEELNEQYEVDEEGYLVIKTPEEGKWALTAAGAAYLDADPIGVATSQLFTKDSVYVPVYIVLLELLEGSAATKREIDDAVDNHPLVQNPRLYSGYFLSNLENIDAAEWKNDKWHVTEHGLDVLDELRAYEKLEEDGQGQAEDQEA